MPTSMQGLLLLLIAMFLGCSKPIPDTAQESVQENVLETVYPIEFQLFYQGEKASCVAEDFRFFVSSIKLNNQSIQLPNNDFQTSNIALLDFFTNRYCRRSVSENLIPYNQTLNVIVPSDFDSNNLELSFTIGLPRFLNHQNPVKAKPPLNQSSMHWQWLSGYKFLRFEYSNQEQLNRFHLGSWGCAGKLPDNIKCKQANLVGIQLKDFKLEKSIVEVHLDALMDIESNTLCMGNPNDQACQSWINALQEDVFRVGQLAL